VDIATIVCLEDFHEIAVPPCKIMKHVCGLVLYGNHLNSQHWYNQSNSNPGVSYRKDLDLACIGDIVRNP
jgi:hypothetical protein